MLEQDNIYQHYFDHFSMELSEEIKDYATEEVFKSSRYIFTQRQGKKQYGYCTHCKNDFRTDGLKHNDVAACPMCKSECRVKAGGRGRKTLVDEAYFTYYQKSVLNPEIMTARGVYAVRDYRGDYRRVKTQYQDAALYIFQIGNSVMLSRYTGFWHVWDHIDYGLWSIRSNVGSMWGRDHIASSSVSVYFSRKNIAKAVKNTPFQYSTWESYRELDMVAFFGLYSKYPCIEYLTKLGFRELVEDKLHNQRTYSAINWNGKTLFNVLKMNKAEINQIKAEKIKVSFLFLKLLQITKKDGSKLSLSEISEISQSYRYQFAELQKVLKYTTLRKAVNYTSMQMDIAPKNNKYNYAVLLTWIDYINCCGKLDMDITNKNVLFPRNLHRAHQNQIKQIKLKADKELDKKIKAIAKKLNAQYGFEYKGLIIKVASSTTELINEGKILNHCVGTYAQGYADGKNIILFVRRKSKPNQPYFTMEIRNGRIAQLRGKNNCPADKRVDAFAEAFKSDKLEKTTKNRVTIPA